jgi:predicted ATPase
MLISAVKIDNFKRIKQVELTLADVTVLIESNNSGKPSLLQEHPPGDHDLAVGALRQHLGIQTG